MVEKKLKELLFLMNELAILNRFIMDFEALKKFSANGDFLNFKESPPNNLSIKMENVLRLFRGAIVNFKEIEDSEILNDFLQNLNDVSFEPKILEKNEFSFKIDDFYYSFEIINQLTVVMSAEGPDDYYYSKKIFLKEDAKSIMDLLDYFEVYYKNIKAMDLEEFLIFKKKIIKIFDKDISGWQAAKVKRDTYQEEDWSKVFYLSPQQKDDYLFFIREVFYGKDSVNYYYQGNMKEFFESILNKYLSSQNQQSWFFRVILQKEIILEDFSKNELQEIEKINSQLIEKFNVQTRMDYLKKEIEKIEVGANAKEINEKNFNKTVNAFKAKDIENFRALFGGLVREDKVKFHTYLKGLPKNYLQERAEMLQFYLAAAVLSKDLAGDYELFANIIRADLDKLLEENLELKELFEKEEKKSQSLDKKNIIEEEIHISTDLEEKYRDKIEEEAKKIGEKLFYKFNSKGVSNDPENEELQEFLVEELANINFADWGIISE